MPKPLLGAGQLIKDTWQMFLKTWDTTVRYAAWFILAGVLQVLYLFFPNSGNGNGYYAISVLGWIAGIVITVWATIMLYQVCMALDAKQKVAKQAMADAMKLFWPFILVAVLAGFATLGATILLIIPGIYVGVRLGFAQLSFLDKNKRGRAALSDSWALTKDKFWAVFWRQIAGALVFGALMMAATFMALWLVGLVAGSGKYDALMSADARTSPGVAGIFTLVSNIVQAAFIPLFFLYQVKLYRALRGAQE